jgi:lysine 2,3-aminomutase
MFLGATPYQMPAIQKAKELGCSVITVSNNLSEIGHSYGDLSLNISTVDKEAILEAAKKYKIDAIMTYATNAAVETVSYVAENLNLHGNALSSAQILQDKGKFRLFQKENNLPYPDFFITNSKNITEKLNELIKKYALIVKPVDAGSSRGQSTITDLNQFNEAFEHAKNNGTNGNIIIEEKIKGTMLELDGDIFFQDGKLAFALYGHNYFKRNSKYNVPVGEIFPGNINEKIKENLDKQFSTIIKKLNLKSGCINFDGLVSEDNVFIIDIALRNGGNFVPKMIELSSGFNMTEASIYAAFGQHYDIKQNAKNEPIVSYILNSDIEGVFNGYKIKPSIINQVVFEQLMVEVSDIVYPFETGNRTLGVVAFKFNTIEEAINFTKNVEDYIEFDIDTQKEAKGTFGIRVSSFINNKLTMAKNENNKKLENILQNQFYLSLKSQSENLNDSDYALKHYEAASSYEFEGKKLLGLERLYRRTLVVEPILQCLANCRHCLRQNYSPFSLSTTDLSQIAKGINTLDSLKDVRELLITGGDPFLIPSKLIHFLNKLAEDETKIKIIRIASRIPIHRPSAINNALISLFKQKYPFRLEMATQINHNLELFPEVKDAYSRISEYVNIYNQTVLLKGINDNVPDLINLCDELRYLGIENHYIFHCVPIKEAQEFRTSIDDSLKLIRDITSSGYISGRAKPQLALMTDVGKVTLYEGSIIDRSDDKILLQTNYNYNDRLKWNPSWTLPANAIINQNGLLQVWYKDK